MEEPGEAYDDREPSTLRRLGEELGISRERVRQMQLEAERSLREGRLLRAATVKGP